MAASEAGHERGAARRVARRVYLAAWLLPLAVVSAQAQPSLGAGDVLCSQYLKAARSSDILYHQASNWLLGYVSGLNAAVKSTGGTAANFTSSEILKSAGNYCETNPSATIATAANEWQAAMPKPAAASQSGSLIINLDRAQKIRPLLDRR